MFDFSQVRKCRSWRLEYGHGFQPTQVKLIVKTIFSDISLFV